MSRFANEGSARAGMGAVAPAHGAGRVLPGVPPGGSHRQVALPAVPPRETPADLNKANRNEARP